MSNEIFIIAIFCFSIASSLSSKQTLLQPPFPDGLNGGKLVTIPSNRLNLNHFLYPSRNVNIWLPPGYHSQTSKNTKYPVIFTHDGQNAMMDSLSWTGSSWRMMGALSQLAKNRLLRSPIPIVVLLDSAKGDLFPGGPRRRHLEYADSGIFADAHMEFVVEKVKPYVQSVYRTNEEEMYLIGSSMGAQASFRILLNYPELFQGVACLSPYFEPSLVASVMTAEEKKKKLLQSKKLYMDIGGDIGSEKVKYFDLMDHLTFEHWWNPGYFWLDSQLQPGVRSMKFALEVSGVAKDNFMYFESPGGRHNERAWAQRINLPLVHFFGKKQ